MVFSSLVFLFLFLPAVLILNFLLPRAGRNLLLLVASLCFYFWGEDRLVLIMLASTVLDYLCGLTIAGAWKSGPVELLAKNRPRSSIQRGALLVSILANLGFLGFFKYLNFGAEIYSSLVGWIGVENAGHAIDIALPLGISFYTFQSMSYTIDVYLGNARATRNFVDFACFVTMFSQLVAGPIVRYRSIAEQLVHRSVTLESFAYGVRRFIIGLGKKVLVANTVALAADRIFRLPSEGLTPGLAWLAATCYTIQIYFDFSGYSDMAIGLGRMLGFHFPENFNYPYKSLSIREFWRRWHISLSTWFRDYLFIPLGGSRVSEPRTYFNLFMVFLLCGLWHGAAWNFVCWGLFHGSFIVFERAGLEERLNAFWRPVRHAYVLLVVMIGWVLFRSDDLAQASSFLAAMAGFGAGDGLTHHLGQYLTPKLWLGLIVGSLGAFPLSRALCRMAGNTMSTSKWPLPLSGLLSAAEAIGLVLIFVASAMALGAGTHNPFIYFRF